MDDEFDVLAGWMIDGTGEPARKSVLIRIERGVISSIRNSWEGKSSDCLHRRLLDFSDCTLLPGLVDSHVHLCFSGTVDPDARARQFGYSFEQRSPLMDERIAKYISGGILALRDGGDIACHGLRYRKERMTGQSLVRFRAAGAGWRARGRYGKFIANTPDEGAGLGECLTSKNASADHIKIINSGLNSLTEFGKQTPPQFSRKELETAVDTARRLGIRTMVHANGRLPVVDALKAGCTSIEHGFFMGRENMEKMAEQQIFWIPTAYSMKSFLLHMPSGIEAQTAARNFDHQLEQIFEARQMGIRVALGTDSGGYGLRHGEAFVEELKVLMEAGFTIEEAIRSGSREGGGLLGLEAELGELKVGMPATFVAVPVPPPQLADSLRVIRSVYVRGAKVG